ncbi:MAG: ABC transporter permease [Bryobacteraceae bacterium]|nr:ABC transporter permease [Bryobacteraceae bacterium]
MWSGDYSFLLRQLILKDFRIRYRNMSLGVFWSLVNPLVMMSVYTYVFTKIFTNPIPYFTVHLLSALISYNFFSYAWVASTTSLLDNVGFVKRIPIRREIIPIAAVLSNLTHLVIQLLLLVGFVYGSGLKVTGVWLWLPLVWGLELLFIIGLGLASSALFVIVRDTRYVVESVIVVLFWIVPVIYSFDMVPVEFRNLYQYNPLAALILATHQVVIGGHAPSTVLLTKLTGVSFASLFAGLGVFRLFERRFYEYL